MRWLMEFYHQRRGILARYDIEAPSPAAAAVLGGDTVRAEHPSAPARRRLSVLERAERARGDDGWVLHRIVEAPGALHAFLDDHTNRVRLGRGVARALPEPPLELRAESAGVGPRLGCLVLRGQRLSAGLAAVQLSEGRAGDDMRHHAGGHVPSALGAQETLHWRA